MTASVRQEWVARVMLVEVVMGLQALVSLAQALPLWALGECMEKSAL